MNILLRLGLFSYTVISEDREKYDRVALNLLAVKGEVTPSLPHMKRAFRRLEKRGACVRSGDAYLTCNE